MNKCCILSTLMMSYSLVICMHFLYLGGNRRGFVHSCLLYCCLYVPVEPRSPLEVQYLCILLYYILLIVLPSGRFGVFPPMPDTIGDPDVSVCSVGDVVWVLTKRKWFESCRLFIEAPIHFLGFRCS